MDATVVDAMAIARLRQGSDSRRTLSPRIDGYWELTIETDLRDLGVTDVVIARTGKPCRQGGPQKRAAPPACFRGK